MSEFVEQLRRQARRPSVVLLLVAIVALLAFPKVGPREVSFRHVVPACAGEIEVSAFQGEEKVRSSTRALHGERAVEHSFLLPKGDYLLRVRLTCPDGQEAQVERTLVLDQNGTIELDLGRECRC